MQTKYSSAHFLKTEKLIENLIHHKCPAMMNSKESKSYLFVLLLFIIENIFNEKYLLFIILKFLLNFTISKQEYSVYPVIIFLLGKLKFFFSFNYSLLPHNCSDKREKLGL